MAKTKFGVPRTTLKRGVEQKHIDNQQVLENFETILNQEQEVKCVQHIYDMEVQMFGLTTHLDCVVERCKCLKKKTKKNILFVNVLDYFVQCCYENIETNFKKFFLDPQNLLLLQRQVHLTHCCESFFNLLSEIYNGLSVSTRHPYTPFSLNYKKF